MIAPTTFWICDGHQDLSLNHHRYGRDITRELAAIRAAEHGTHRPWGTATVSLPEMRNGNVGMAFVTLLALARLTDHPPGECEAATPEQAHAIAMRDLDYYRRLEDAGHVRIIGDRASLDAHAAQWDSGAADRRLGVVLLMEGAEPILAPSEAAEWRERGLRIIGPAWFGENRYARGTGTPGGLTNLGRELLEQMVRAGLILDVSHLAEAGCLEALDLFGGTIIASHSNARALVPGDRQLSDVMIRRLIRRDAVIGIALDAWMLVPGWRHGQSNANVRLAAVADHIDHVCQLAGDAGHAAIGSDLDGGFGREQCPADIDSIADLPRLLEVLSDRGYPDDDIRAIAHGNWLGVLRRAWQ
ncbi:MAG TPA: membrane dipeptidase [Phycisphaerae bacterium]|nr:membrane dipeptidase [Phycisphaerae bacterium]